MPPPRRSARRGRARLPRTAAVLLALLCAAGCPRRFDPRAEELTSPSPPAQAAYQQAKEQLHRGDADGASQALSQFPAQFPQDPLLPEVALLRARALLKLGQAAAARDLAEPLAHPAAGSAAPPLGVSQRARFILGLCRFQLGDAAGARSELLPFAADIVDSDDGTELHAVLAELHRQAGQAQDALREYDRFYHGAGARPAERAYVRAQVSRLLPILPPAEQRAAERRFELLVPVATQGPAAGLLLGLVLPLSGKERALGERVLHGALTAAGALAPEPGAAAGREAPRLPIDLRVRDSGSSPEQAALAVDALAREGVAALVGSPARSEAAQIAAQAQKAGLPLIDLSPPAAGEAGAAGVGVFHLLRSNAARAEALAQHVRQQGIGTVAVLAPSSAYGKAVTRAFVAALAGSGPGPAGARPVKVLGPLFFADGATTFTAQAQELLSLRPEAVFIPATAQKLELIAAQLASTGVIATQNVAPSPGRGAAGPRHARVETGPGLPRPGAALVLSTAEGLGERLLRNAGRYLQGAVLAPISVGSLPLVQDPGNAQAQASAALAMRYQQRDGQEPTALDALGHDAVQVLAAACPAAPCEPARLALALPGVHAEGATGAIAFGAGGARAGIPLLVRVEEGGLRALRPSGPVGWRLVAPGAEAGW